VEVFETYKILSLACGGEPNTVSGSVKHQGLMGTKFNNFLSQILSCIFI